MTGCPISEPVDGPRHAISAAVDEVGTAPGGENFDFVAAKRALEDGFGAEPSVLATKKHLVRVASHVRITDDGGVGR